MLQFVVRHYDVFWNLAHGTLAAGVALLAIGLLLKARRARAAAAALPVRDHPAIAPAATSDDWSRRPR